jgi:hypothetical protein
LSVCGKGSRSAIRRNIHKARWKTLRYGACGRFLQVANPIYREVIMRVLGSSFERFIPAGRPITLLRA